MQVEIRLYLHQEKVIILQIFSIEPEQYQETYIPCNLSVALEQTTVAAFCVYILWESEMCLFIEQYTVLSWLLWVQPKFL